MGEGTEQRTLFIRFIDGVSFVYKVCLKVAWTWPGMIITNSVRRLKR